MVITHINTHDAAGGAAKFAFRLASWQRETGSESKMLVGVKRTTYDWIEDFEHSPSEALEERCRRLGLLYYEIQGSHFLPWHRHVANADIIHLHNLHGGYFNPFSLFLLSAFKPCLWTIHDMNPFTGHCANSFECDNWQKRCGCESLEIYPSLEFDSTHTLMGDKRDLYQNCDLVLVAPSKWMSRNISRSILSDAPKQVIYNCVDTELFRPRRKRLSRQKFNLPAANFTIGTVAHLGVENNPWKGAELSQAVIGTLKRLHPNWTFIEIGSNRRWRHGNSIGIGSIEDEMEMSFAYSSLDVLLNTSLADNCPLIIIEAMSCGIPIVSLATGGIPELVQESETGKLIEQENVSCIARAIESIEGSLILRHRMRFSARRNATAKFGKHNMLAQYESAYKQTIARWRPHQSRLHLGRSVPAIIRTKAFQECIRKMREGT